MTTGFHNRRRVVAGGFHCPDYSLNVGPGARIPTHGGAPLRQLDGRAGDTDNALNRFGHMPRAVVAAHAGDRELGGGCFADDRIRRMVFHLNVHKPVYPSMPAATVKFALTRSAAFH